MLGIYDQDAAADLVSQDILGTASADIYDCAVDRSHGQDRLKHIRDALDTAPVALQFVTIRDDCPERAPETLMFRTDREQGWSDALQRLSPGIANIDTLFGSGIDAPMSRMSRMSTIEDAEVQTFEFYHERVEPRGKRAPRTPVSSNAAT